VKYYTYIAVDLRKPGRYSFEGLPFSFLYEPFYVGKGKEYRWRQRTHKNAHVRHLMKILGDPTKYTILLEADSSETALQREQDVIRLIGRKDFGIGPLLNLTDGGEGTVGWKMPSEVKEKIFSKTRGRKRTDEFKQMRRKVMLGTTRTEIANKRTSLSMVNRGKGDVWWMVHPNGKNEITNCLTSFCRKYSLPNNFVRDGKAKGFYGRRIVWRRDPYRWEYEDI
jgi:hypothetical protein